MASPAAVFDLDRTLLSVGSGPVLARALRRAGIGPEREVPGMGAMFSLFNRIGETWPSMFVTRQAARASSGWDVAAAEAAAAEAAAELAEMVLPYARIEIERHRDEGRRLVLATTTPEHLIAPLADELGFDGVVATRYGRRDGRFDGTIDGHFVWGRGKLRAVREWAEEQGVSLRESYAYSDSYYDVPLLNGVGHPTAVNPDARLEVVARLRGWPVRWFDTPDGVPKLFAGLVEPQRLGQPLARGELSPFARIDITGADHIPEHGPVIVVFNHRSYFDSTAMGALFAEVGRPARFLGKKEVFDAPVVGAVAKAMGGIRVDRGTGSEEPLRRAVEALRAGELICIAPQGTIPRGPAFFDPELRGRWGAARLAADTGSPVVPVGVWGTEKIWPRNRRLPRWRPDERPLVTVTVGQPMEVDGDDPDADTRAIMAAIVDLLPPEARAHREPTPEELAATYPPGYAGDPTREADRRPGTDT